MTVNVAFCRIPVSPSGLPVVQVVSAEDIANTTSSVANATACPSAGLAVRIMTDTDIRVAFGASPTATATNNLRMPANSVEYFDIQVGDKVAVINT